MASGHSAMASVAHDLAAFETNDECGGRYDERFSRGYGPHKSLTTEDVKAHKLDL